jgi:Uma2 family endonuclease
MPPGETPVKPLTVEDYFQLPETVRPMELVYGVVREPPAPGYGHQLAVTRLAVLLALHVREHDLGQICVSPVDVVLDTSAGLVVQPDIIFIAHANRGIVCDRVWGAPDLVVEILSPARRSAIARRSSDGTDATASPKRGSLTHASFLSR